MNIKPIYIVILTIILLSGMANGTMDTLQFHHPQSIFREASDYWNPSESWKMKYVRDEEGNPVQPLKPAYFGSTTFLVWTTDGWHLVKTIFFALLRTALVLAAASAWRLHRNKIINLAAWVGVWIGLAMVQAVGFHATYSWLLKL